ncbi:hypothetical protein BgiBS90_030940 [Biomphalaria glabrata]|nr:hypothetical protein BgiBS90_030940 [Biomphalaria glabrata]
MVSRVKRTEKEKPKPTCHVGKLLHASNARQNTYVIKLISEDGFEPLGSLKLGPRITRRLIDSGRLRGQRNADLRSS